MKLLVFVVALLQLGNTAGFTSRAVSSFNLRSQNIKTPTFSTLDSVNTSSGDDSSVGVTSQEDKKKEKRRQIREEGGIFAFNTKYGALNPFAIYYGLVAIFLGIPWFFALMFCKLFYFVTRGKIDTQVNIIAVLMEWQWSPDVEFSFFRLSKRRMPVFISHVWGVVLMRLTGCYPKRVNREILKEYFKR